MEVLQVFFDVSEPIYPDEARQLVAKSMDGCQTAMMAVLMNYLPGEPVTAPGFPPVHFARHKRGFALLAYGAEAAMLVRDMLPLIHKKLCEQLSRAVHVSSRLMTMSIESRPYSMQYVVPKMVVQKRKRDLERLQDSETGKDLIEKVFLSSLSRQAEFHGICLPDNTSVRFCGAAGTFIAKPPAPGAGGRLGLRDAVFEVNLRLGGIWAAGRQLSKGYGHFNATAQLGGV